MDTLAVNQAKILPSSGATKSIEATLPTGKTVNARLTQISPDQNQPNVYKIKLETNNVQLQVSVKLTDKLPQQGSNVSLQRLDSGKIQININPDQPAASKISTSNTSQVNTATQLATKIINNTSNTENQHNAGKITLRAPVVINASGSSLENIERVLPKGLSIAASVITGTPNNNQSTATNNTLLNNILSPTASTNPNPASNVLNNNLNQTTTNILKQINAQNPAITAKTPNPGITNPPQNAPISATLSGAIQKPLPSVSVTPTPPANTNSTSAVPSNLSSNTGVSLTTAISTSNNSPNSLATTPSNTFTSTHVTSNPTANSAVAAPISTPANPTINSPVSSVGNTVPKTTAGVTANITTATPVISTALSPTAASLQTAITPQAPAALSPTAASLQTAITPQAPAALSPTAASLQTAITPQAPAALSPTTASLQTAKPSQAPAAISPTTATQQTPKPSQAPAAISPTAANAQPAITPQAAAALSTTTANVQTAITPQAPAVSSNSALTASASPQVTTAINASINQTAPINTTNTPTAAPTTNTGTQPNINPASVAAATTTNTVTQASINPASAAAATTTPATTPNNSTTSTAPVVNSGAHSVTQAPKNMQLQGLATNTTAIKISVAGQVVSLQAPANLPPVQHLQNLQITRSEGVQANIAWQQPSQATPQPNNQFLLSPKQASLVEHSLKQALPQQIPIAEGINQLVAQTNQMASSSVPIDKIALSIMQMFGVKPGSLNASDSVKRNVQQGGLFSENKMLNQPSAVQGDMKNFLAKLNHLAEKLPTEQKEMLQSTTERMLARVTSNQLTHVQQQHLKADISNERSFQIDIPVQHNEQLDNIEMEIKQRKHLNEEGDFISIWSVKLHFDLEARGEVDAEVALNPTDNSISTTFLCSQLSTVQALNRKMDAFREQLSQHGFEIQTLHCTQGSQAAIANNHISKLIVDIRT